MIEVNIQTSAQRLNTCELQQPLQSPVNEQSITELTGLCSLFRFATKKDVFLIIMGTICAVIAGVSVPALGVLEGSMATTEQQGAQLEDRALTLMFYFFYIGIGAFAANWIMSSCWMIAAERQSIACRKEYFRSLLRQEIGWFDTANQSQISTKFATNCNAYKEAIGQKMSTIIMTIFMLVACFAVAAFYGWLLTVVMLASIPLIVLGGHIFAGALEREDSEHDNAYTKAGGLTQQAFSAIKTVKQLNGEQFEANLYAQVIKQVATKSIFGGTMIGLGQGVLEFAIIASYALCFWFGSHCVEGSALCPSRFNGGQTYSTEAVLIIFFTFLQTGFYYNQLPPAFRKLTQGRMAATRIFKIIDRKPLIESPQNPLIPEQFKGVIKFEDITFSYPKDKSTKILSHLDLEIDVRSSAFVGDSGCGKSTILQLLMRFYDPDQGRITLDGNDLRALDLDWLRGQIGYVGQEPVLFATTIKENLLLGKEDATDDQIIEVLVKAEAFDFVYQLKENLNTYVGTGGGQISGGQKQRLAIARALLKNPKIIIFDEATSALDRKNQKLIQSTINMIAEERIVISIAHRVRTIAACKKIFVLQKGNIKQQGSFKQLQRFLGVQIVEDEQQEQDLKLKILQKRATILISESKANAQNHQVSQQSSQMDSEDEQKLKKYNDSIMGRLLVYVSDKKLLFTIGALIAITNGLIYPFLAIFMSSMLAVLLQFSNNSNQARSDSNFNGLIIFILAIATFILNIFLRIIFYNIGESMIQKIRNQTYLKILKMPIPWFQRSKNTSGVLSDRLSSDCRSINNLVSNFMIFLIQNITILISGLIIAFIFEWRTALVATGLLPLIILNGYMEMAQEESLTEKTKKLYQQSSIYITQSINNIRTITSLGCQNIIYNRYSKKLEKPYNIAFKKSIQSGFLLGLSELILFFIIGIISYIGIVFMVRNDLTADRVFTAIYAIIFSGIAVGNNIQMTPDIAAGKLAASSIFQILDSTDQDQLQIQTNSKMIKSVIKGHIQFKRVSFKYESRDDQVFSELSFQIKKGHKVALVGPSGCGKSTILQLLQRFYDIDQGDILIDGISIADYDIHHLRTALGVVSQEPVLFNNTIGWNIQYNRMQTTQEEIITAANQSNFNPEKQEANYLLQSIKFVEETQERQERLEIRKSGSGFDKNVGVKGSHISGGQKQRVAIARTILRRPQILLLDEATSALDSANQKKVQESLDRLLMGIRTSITIAHRFETIKNSDEILVFQQGKIVEKGSYSDLMSKKNSFYRYERGSF